MAKEKNKDKLGFTKFWGWQLRGVSLGCMTIIIGYLQIYCTDTLGLNGAIIGAIMLGSKIIDAFTDLIAGFIIENTKTKLGKARPYELCMIPLWICTWLLFSVPQDSSNTIKYIWIFFMYVFINSIFSTFLISNQTPYMLRAFDSQEKIVKVNSYGGIVVTIGCAVVSILFPQMMATMATSSAGWSSLVGIFCLPLFVLGMMRFLFVKETVSIDGEEDSKITLSEVIDVLKHNKYIYIVCGISILYNVIISMNSYTYYFKWIGGGIERYSSLAAISMPLLLVMFIFPILMKKGIAMSRIILFGSVLGVIGYILNFFAGDNMGILLTAAALYSFAGLPIAYLSGLLILDCSEYNILTGKKRMETTMSAISSFGTKVGGGLGSALVGVILSVFGYNGAAQVQTASALTGIKVIFSFVPAIMYAIIVILCIFYKLDKVLIEKRQELQK
ncbi:MFS transporter [Streptococcus moroccensis]|uniref:Na+/melibiose symporter-like transporter n=1 Tax=Streptococcus moroccensis TaxID=1451356 RepID=A0ABT9YPC2_9STRE|nr:MFS transporter [Streptococcus moroccensis]MDQ0221836.1 Na+/melibiose symporter-like transporter [Streptococcus moroccensis]